MKTLSVIVATTVVVSAGICASFFVACTKSSESSANLSKPTGQLVSAAQISNQSNGTFTATGLVSATPIAARFQRGCLNPGEDDPAFANIDLRLKVGQKFQTRMQTGSPGETMDYTANGSIISFDETHSVLRGQIDASTGTVGVGAGTPFSTTCTVTNVTDGSAAQQSVSCLADSSLDNPKHQTCRVEQSTPVISEVQGTYQFASGLTVNAFKIIHRSTGTIYCQIADGPETSMGLGSEISETVVSNAVVSVAPRDCGGNIIYSFHSASTDNGVLEAVEKSEQIVMPIDAD